MRIIELLLVCGVLLLVSGTNAFGQFQIEGKAGDIVRFSNLIQECKSKSSVFSDLMSEINRTTHLRNFNMILILDASGNPAGHHKKSLDLRNNRIDTWGEDYSNKIGLIRVNTYVVDINDLDQFPRAYSHPETGEFEVKNAPSWALTICQVLGHELKEQLDGYLNGFDYNKNHLVALNFENKMRKEFGQPKRKDDVSQTNGSKIIPIGTNKVIISIHQGRLVVDYEIQ